MKFPFIFAVIWIEEGLCQPQDKLNFVALKDFYGLLLLYAQIRHRTSWPCDSFRRLVNEHMKIKVGCKLLKENIYRDRWLVPNVPEEFIP